MSTKQGQPGVPHEAPPIDPPNGRPDEAEGKEGTNHLARVTVEICPNPVFVIGSPRSGTSVLPWALAHHFDFWTSQETEFIHGLFGEGEAVEVYANLCKKKGTFITHHNVDHKEFFSSLGLGINALISRRSEGRRWIDQSPGYTTMAWTLADMFPGSYFIHVLRDGRAVVNSMLHFADHAAAGVTKEALPPWATDFETAVQTWKHYVDFALTFVRGNPDRTITVRNEDLVEHTKDEFKRLFDFLGASDNTKPAEFFRNSRINSSFGPLVWSTDKQGENVPRATAADAWRDWTSDQRARFLEIAGDLLERLEYPIDPAV